ncbi:hypothetical protein [Bacillus cereus group sp. BfR-BA-01409]|uniref:hypothetical protein n=1 Tax=Bacillus cereus group sp. BfR-BA-01409 TaxID=2920338 RepID=UPI001F5A12FE
MLARYHRNWVKNLKEARQFIIRRGISNRSRGNIGITHYEMIGMLYSVHYQKTFWNAKGGFSNAITWGEHAGIFTDTRGNEVATRGEIFVMLHNCAKKFTQDKL